LAQQCTQHEVLTLISLASWHTAHGALHSHKQLDVSCSSMSHVQANAQGSAKAGFQHATVVHWALPSRFGILPHQKYVTPQSPQGFSIKPYFARRRLRDCMWTTASGRRRTCHSSVMQCADAKARTSFVDIILPKGVR
jgi:hypothetical protein